MKNQVLIACSALRKELDQALGEMSHQGRVVYIEAGLHLRPSLLEKELVQTLEREGRTHDRIIVVYGKCFPKIDRLCQEKGAIRTPGEHCFHIFLGDRFHDLIQEEPGTYFLNKHLSDNFDELCIQGLGLDRFPKLKKVMFGNYKRAIYIETLKEGLPDQAVQVAEYLELPVTSISTGIEALKKALQTAGIKSARSE